ncbi:MAG: HipA domain-containing protein [bacterium]
MNCLHCNKKLLENEIDWHKKCIKKFFSTTKIPSISLNDEELNKYIINNINNYITVPGVQKKMSLTLNVESNKLTLVNFPTRYILKPQTEEFEYLPEAEHLVMSLANISNLITVDHALIRIGNEYAYITKRIDRDFKGNKLVKLAMEDFCQLDLRLTEDKYLGSYERCIKIIEKYSSQSKLDIVELFMRIIFSFIVGNSDMHLKNFSIIEDYETKGYYLCPSYDILPVNIILKSDLEQTALTLNGIKKNITKKDLVVFGRKCELTDNTINKIFKKFIGLETEYINLINESYISDLMKIKLINLINERIKIIS